MSANARMAASITPSSFFRAVDAHKVSIFVDEADNVVKGMNPDLLAIMNCRRPDDGKGHALRGS